MGIKRALKTLAIAAGAWMVAATGLVATHGDTSPRVALTAGQLIQISPFQGQCPVFGDLEGRFGPDEMPAYLSCIVPDVDQWLGTFYPGMPHPSGYYFVPPGGQFRTGCTGAATQDSLMYCPGDGAVYLGAAAVWSQYSGHGDGAPVTVLAHEVTHHIQHMRGMPPSQTPRAQIRYENQADCGAGAFMAYSRNMGRLAKNDIRDLAGSLVEAASREGPGRDHGTIDERLNSFDLSYLSTLPIPLWACNQFVPELPLMP